MVVKYLLFRLSGSRLPLRYLIFILVTITPDARLNVYTQWSRETIHAPRRLAGGSRQGVQGFPIKSGRAGVNPCKLNPEPVNGYPIL